MDDDLSAHTAVREALTTFDDRWALRSYERAGQALERIPVERPAVVLMDIWMPAMSGLECAGRLKALVPDLPVVMFTGRADASGILLSLMAGAHGYLIKPVAPAELDRALQAVLKGETPLCPRAQTLLAGHYRSLGAALTDATNLTLREREVLVCLIRHMHDKDIAEQLGISGGTVHVHVSSILGKLGVHSRAELLKKIYRLT